ncbi:hypothetical protein Q2T49_34215, partial [Pseudomonas aeruginosa]|uniref:hypothetical protein n=1 Tax=Pseudomonas aeruginosa TaxID=287 RepID=UPI002708506F|nr:hypothetical protein [Pseudomonas aeruginosa]
ALGTSGISIDKLYLHDNDGLATTTGITGATGTAGALAISDVTLKQTGTGNLLDLAIDTNGASSTNGAFLNVAATVGAVDIHVGSIGALGTSGISIDKLYLHDNDGLATTTGITGATGTA